MAKLELIRWDNSKRIAVLDDGTEIELGTVMINK